jgi:RNA polymerase sigma-70 factor (ECF subfamily)
LAPSSIPNIDAQALRVGDGKRKPLRKAGLDHLPFENSSRAESPSAELESSFQAATLAAIPHLRAFAFSFSLSEDRVDDLVQETLLRAYSNFQQFEPGTNLNAWLITILRNALYSEWRIRRREVEDGDGAYAETLVVHAEQISKIECEEFSKAFDRLPEEMRRALLLIGAYGFSYLEVARLYACAVGTVKSRVNRARGHLAAMLSPGVTGHLVESAISQSVAIQSEQGRLPHRR